MKAKNAISKWRVAGLSGCILTSSQHFSKYENIGFLMLRTIMHIIFKNSVPTSR
jgi:hypothetical protein